MKRVEAVFSPLLVTNVAERLRMIGVPGITLHETHVMSAQPRVLSYRGVESKEDMEDAARFDIVVPDNQVESIVNAVLLTVRKNAPGAAGEGDGYVYVAPIEEVIRIRTGETGEDAL